MNTISNMTIYDLIAGEMAVNECGPSVAGLAYWPCDLEGHWQTSMPDFSQCQSYWLQKLRGQLDKTADRQASIGTYHSYIT